MTTIPLVYIAISLTIHLIKLGESLEQHERNRLVMMTLEG
ncbi:hypothetical protein SynA15127_01512 [Synechococcus sp. A15-127]|nr:hypothetical protein SynA15127_01512 [Synechococcus sp. A15-127]